MACRGHRIPEISKKGNTVASEICVAVVSLVATTSKDQSGERISGGRLSGPVQVEV